MLLCRLASSRCGIVRSWRIQAECRVSLEYGAWTALWSSDVAGWSRSGRWKDGALPNVGPHTFLVLEVTAAIDAVLDEKATV